jgi:endoplasmic reticulum junction formation protein lunapark
VSKISLFKAAAQKNDDDYESILSTLANDIRNRQLKLSEIRLRERRSTLLATLYTLGTWVAYVSVWYCDSLPVMKTSNPGVAKGVKVLPVLFGPVVYVFIPASHPASPNSQCRILFIRRIVQIWYQRKGDAEGEIILVVYHPTWR